MDTHTHTQTDTMYINKSSGFGYLWETTGGKSVYLREENI